MNQENDEKVYENSVEIDELEPELYYLIASFLKHTRFNETSKCLEDEIKNKNILPSRCDIYGDKHLLEYNEMTELYKHLDGNRLSSILQQSVKILRSPNKKEYPGLSSLLSSVFPSKSSNKTSSFINSYLTPRNIIDGIFTQQYSNFRELNKYDHRTQMYKEFKMHKRISGHLAAVYCVIFDHTGNNIITGSDDKLIKIWKSRNGFLVATLRGHTAEICDLAISYNNIILASCSCDKSVRLWYLKSTAQIAVLNGHSGAVTSIKFCPYSFNATNYLISTGNDGCICFWKYSDLFFDTEPIKFNEKIRTNSQILCSSFSPGGNYLAVGSTDSLIYIFELTEDKIIRTRDLEEHTDRVDTIEFAHNGERFVSSSRDGTARIWFPKGMSWSSTILKPLQNDTSMDEIDFVNKSSKLKILTVTWNLSDLYIIGSCTDHSIKIWCSMSGDILRTFKAHTDSIFVIDCHSQYPNVFLTAGHDGLIVVWDINRETPLKVISNQLEDRGMVSIFDAKNSPTDCMIAAGDSYGHLCILGFGLNDQYNISPDQQFFNTDYRPIYTEENDIAYDEQTGMLPHMMPPPILVDMEGNPHPLIYQIFLLGRKSDYLTTITNINSAGSNKDNQAPPFSGATSAPGIRSIGNVEGVRQAGNVHFSLSLSDEDVRRWRQRTIVKELSEDVIMVIKETTNFLHNHEIEFYQNIRSNCDPLSLELEERKSKLKSLRSKVIRRQLNDQETNGNLENIESNPNNTSVVYIDHVEPSSLTYLSPMEIPSDSSEEPSMSDDEYSEYSENLECSVRRKISTRRNEYGEDEKSDNSNQDHPSTSDEQSSAFSESYLFLNQPSSVNEILISPHWILTEKSNRSPYYPQVGDVVMYFLQGHKAYVNYVTRNKLYSIVPNKLCYNKTFLKSQEVCRVSNITYIRGYPYLCSLTLSKLDTNGTYSTGSNFSLQYTEIPNVDDFIVLKQFYDSSVNITWSEHKRFRSFIDDQWWCGTVLELKPFNKNYKNCPFKSIYVKWDTGEFDTLSPWDIFEVIDGEDNITNFNYIPTEDDWGDETQGEAYQRILAALETLQLMPQFKLVDNFIAEKTNEEYMPVSFPTSLCKLSKRCVNLFYRRKKAIIWEIRMILSNVKSLKPSQEISQNCEILIKVLITCIKEVTYDIIELVDRFGQVEEDIVNKKTTNMNNTKVNTLNVDISPVPNELLWVFEAKTILNYLMNLSDCEPFLNPVNMTEYSDYYDFIKNPVDFKTISDRLKNGYYLLPDDFANDIKLIFSNSRLYNTNPRSAIYGMTLRLNSLFKKKIESLLPKWRLEALGSNSHITRQKFRSLVNYLDQNTDLKPRYLQPATNNNQLNDLQNQRRVTRSMQVNNMNTDDSPPIRRRLRNHNTKVSTRHSLSRIDDNDDSFEQDINNSTRRKKRKIVISDSSRSISPMHGKIETRTRHYLLRSNPLSTNSNEIISHKRKKRFNTSFQQQRSSSLRLRGRRKKTCIINESSESVESANSIQSSSNRTLDDSRLMHRSKRKYQLRSLNINDIEENGDNKLYQNKLRKRKPTNYEEK